MVRTRLVALVGAALLTVGIAPAQAASDDPQSAAAYPVTSWLSMLDGLATNLTDPTVLQYTAEAGALGVAPRAIDNNPELTDPAQLQDEEAFRWFLQRGLDSLKSRPTLLGSNALIVGTPHLMPDWDGDGVYGNAGDYDIDNSPHPAVARFRYPCVEMDATFTYETTDGRCLPWDTTEDVTFRLGKVHKLDGVVNSRGMKLAVKLWLPDTALTGGRKHPGVVFADGNLSRQSDYYVYHQRLARAGYIVMSFDQAGQGDSEGSFFDLFSGPAVPGCPGVTGACRDLQDMVRWFTGGTITPVVDLENENGNGQDRNWPRVAPRRNPAHAPAGENMRNPVLKKLDMGRIGITGQSMGSISTTTYLQRLGTGDGVGADGRPLPMVKAAVAISGWVPLSNAVVPIQIQTADYDIPAMEDNGGGSLDGPVGAKKWYENLRATGKGDGAVSMIIIEGGMHEAQSNVPIVPRSPWTAALSTSYQVDWFDCYLKRDKKACERAGSPRPHLSRATASEIDPDGPAGEKPSFCITVPDAAASGDPNSFETLLGQQVHDCVEQ